MPSPDPTTDVKMSVNKYRVREGKKLSVVCKTNGYPLNDYVSHHKYIVW